MAAPKFYPSLPNELETRLLAVQIALVADPGFLDDKACPYSPTLRKLLKMMSATSRAPVDKIFEGTTDADKFDLILREVEVTIEDMRDIGADVGAADPSDRIQFVKAKTSLLEKWVTTKEKIYNLKEIAEFQGVIIRFLDDIVDKDQRLKFIAALRGLRSVAKLIPEEK